MSTIKYFLPEDGDNEENPNVFLAPKPSRPGYPPLLGQIKDSFPLPGSYHFRFKTALVPGTDRDKHAVAVWMDCVDDSKPVPVWQNSIVAKVTRFGLDDEGYVESTVPLATGGVPAAARVRTDSNVSAASAHSSHQPDINQSSTHDSLLGSFDDAPAPAAAASSGNLLDVDNHHHPPSAPASGNSLLDMDVGGYGRSGANTPTTAHDELLNMSAPMPSQSQPQQQQQQPMQQQTPMKNQYGMQYPTNGQQQQRTPATNANGHSFNNSLNPLDNLKW